MSQSDPQGLKDKNKRQKIDNWTVPLMVNGHHGAIRGTLTWVPLPNAPPPVGAIIAFPALIIVLSLLVFTVRRRRAEAAAASGPDEVAEAW